MTTPLDATPNRRDGTAPTRAPHPFLSGIYRPMTQELTLVELEVTGALPPGLDGSYLRIGPNPIAPDPDTYNWFIGDGMVHALRIQHGRALWYRNRWIRSRRVAAALGEAPAPGPRLGFFDTVNTNVVEIGGRAHGLVEAGSSPVEFSEALDDQRYHDFEGDLTGAFSGHPHRDPLTGEHHAICYDAGRPNEIRHVVVDAAARVIRQEPIAVEHGPCIHDCAITSRYVVILDLPVAFSREAAFAGGDFPYRWRPDQQARVGLLPRMGSARDVLWRPVEPAYVFHTANAYDLPDGRVALDLCAFSSMFDNDGGGPSGRPRGLERWIVDPAGGPVEVRTLDPSAQEFPRVDERRLGQPYRYAWTVALPEPRSGGAHGAALYGHDLETGARQAHDFGPGRHPGEFVFVPSRPDAAEGEGWLMGLVVDLPAERTELVLLDATAIESSTVARVHLPHRVPPGFHGNWIASGGRA